MNRGEKNIRQSEAQERLDRLTETAAMFAGRGRGIPSAVIDEASLAVIRGGKLNRHKASEAFFDAVTKAAGLVRDRADDAKSDRDNRRRMAIERPGEWLEL